MAVTFTTTVRKVFVSGDRKRIIADVSCSGTPTAGGDTYNVATQLGLDLEVNDCEFGTLVKSDGTAAVTTATIAPASGSAYKVVFLTAPTTPAAGTAYQAFTGNTNLGGTASFRVQATGKGKAAG